VAEAHRLLLSSLTAASRNARSDTVTLANTVHTLRMAAQARVACSCVRLPAQRDGFHTADGRYGAC
jgi:hypothetical protein